MNEATQNKIYIFWNDNQTDFSLKGFSFINLFITNLIIATKTDFQIIYISTDDLLKLLRANRIRFIQQPQVRMFAMNRLVIAVKVRTATN